MCITQESLENLRELTARLSRTPSPNTAAAIHDNDQHNPTKPISISQYKRSRSLELLDEEASSHPPHDGAVPTSKVSKSVSAMQLSKAVEHDYDHPRPSSAFQKAIADAGILTPLPKPPSSGNLTSVGFPRRTPVVTSRHDANYGKDLWVSRKKNSWSEALLDEQNPSLPTLTNFVDLHSSGRIESHPRSVDFGSRAQNGNNNSAVMTQYAHNQRSSIRASHSQYRRVEVPPQISPSRRPPVPHNKYSRHTGSSMKVVRHDVDPASDRWIDLTQLSPNHSPQIRHFPHQQPTTTVNRSASAITRINIRHRQAEVAPPPYHHPSIRARRYVIPDDVMSASTSSWSRTKRKNSSSIAVQTENSSDLNRSTMV